MHMKIRNNGISKTKSSMIIHQNSNSCVMDTPPLFITPKPLRGCGLYYNMESCFALLLEFHRYYVLSLVFSFMNCVSRSGMVGPGVKNARIALTRNKTLPMRFRIFIIEDKLFWLSPGQRTHLLAKTMALSSPHTHACNARGIG
jgi:hypothetical protein